MSRKQRAQSLREAKDKRMKKVAAGGAVLLAVVLAFEVPKMLNNGSSGATPPAATTTATTATTGTAAPTPTTTPAGTAAAATLTPTASTKLPNSDVQPGRGKAQLYSFSEFAGKDPFVQQVVDTSSSASGGAGGSGGGGSSKTSATGATATAAVSNSSARTLAVTGAAKIAVNGRVEVVRVGASFPSANPLFKLVGISHGVARVGIANGSYSSGARTVSLVVGRTLTLVDTADGVRYRIRLVSAA